MTIAEAYNKFYDQLTKNGTPNWLRTVGIVEGTSDDRIIVYLAKRKYPKELIPAEFHGWKVEVKYMGGTQLLGVANEQ